jgi:hypothetical protein
MKKIIVLTFLFSVQLIGAQNKIYDKEQVDTAPQYPGGFFPFIEFTGKNFKRTEEKNQRRIIWIECVVQANGKLTKIKVLDPEGTLYEKEAVRVMSISSKWSPAILNGKAVACRTTEQFLNPYAEEPEEEIMGPEADPMPITVVEEKRIEDENTIYDRDYAEVKPEFPGGNQALLDFLRTHYKKPEGLKENTKGNINLTFVVEKDGTLTDIVLRLDVGYSSGAEVVRVLKIAPKWNPGIRNGKNIRVKSELSVPIGSILTSPIEKK